MWQLAACCRVIPVFGEVLTRPCRGRRSSMALLASPPSLGSSENRLTPAEYFTYLILLMRRISPDCGAETTGGERCVRQGYCSSSASHRLNALSHRMLRAR